MRIHLQERFPAQLTDTRYRDQKPSTNRRSSLHSPSSPSGNKLEELLPPVLNRLTPSNLKKTASDFMKEWEKSLSSPPERALPTA